MAVQLVFLAATPPVCLAQSSCDLNGDRFVNVIDAQWASNMLFGIIPCTAAIAGRGVCNVVVVQRVINAVLGGPCVVDGAPAPHSAMLTWTASTSPNVVGYNIYRRSRTTDAYARVNSALVTQTRYEDTTIIADQTYAYVATAVDRTTNESGFSNEAQAMMSADDAATATAAPDGVVVGPCASRYPCKEGLMDSNSKPAPGGSVTRPPYRIEFH